MICAEFNLFFLIFFCMYMLFHNNIEYIQINQMYD